MVCSETSDFIIQLVSISCVKVMQGDSYSLEGFLRESVE